MSGAVYGDWGIVEEDGGLGRVRLGESRTEQLSVRDILRSSRGALPIGWFG